MEIITNIFNSIKEMFNGNGDVSSAISGIVDGATNIKDEVTTTVTDTAQNAIGTNGGIINNVVDGVTNLTDARK
jgi:phage-related protein